eukprot:c14504_g1_i1.p1 GENE.c14504_g1_i1~~c14504_g1_i1.p1  ORF type:complete len:448 (+),score=104.19 c14504_g1_i1:805-2148(+)
MQSSQIAPLESFPSNPSTNATSGEIQCRSLVAQLQDRNSGDPSQYNKLMIAPMAAMAKDLMPASKRSLEVTVIESLTDRKRNVFSCCLPLNRRRRASSQPRRSVGYERPINLSNLVAEDIDLLTTLVAELDNGTGLVQPQKLRALIKSKFDLDLSDSELRHLVKEQNEDGLAKIDFVRFLSDISQKLKVKRSKSMKPRPAPSLSVPTVDDNTLATDAASQRESINTRQDNNGTVESLYKAAPAVVLKGSNGEEEPLGMQREPSVMVDLEGSPSFPAKMKSNVNEVKDARHSINVREKLFTFDAKHLLLESDSFCQLVLAGFDRELPLFNDCRFELELEGLYEMRVQFPPTFPFALSPNSSALTFADTRAPGWCDRILMTKGAQSRIKPSEGPMPIPAGTGIDAGAMGLLGLPKDFQLHKECHNFYACLMTAEFVSDHLPVLMLATLE